MGLFGGTKKHNILTRDQRELLSNLNQILVGELGQPAEVYGGPIVPEATGLQQEAWGGLMSLMAGTPERDIATGRLLSGQPSTEIDPEVMERYWEEAVIAPSEVAYQDYMRAADERLGAGTRSGFHREGLARSAERFGTQLGGIRADLAYRDEQARRGLAESAANRMVSGVQASNQNIGTDISRYGAALAGGEDQRRVQSQLYGEDYAKWMAGQPYYNPWLGFMPTALGTRAFGIGQEANIGGALLGAAGPIASGLADWFI